MQQSSQPQNDVEPETSASGAAESAVPGAGGASVPPQTEESNALAEAREKAQTYLDLAQRTQADFVNYKRRVEQERSDYARSARADIILKIIPTLDDLERAVASRPDELAKSDWAQGVTLIERKLRASLESLGLKRIEAVGQPFDPWQEEAVLHEPSVNYPPGTVIQVVRPGYTLDGRVIRPAQVIVSSGPPDQTQ
jgi:molecular chaperone GrpE